MRSICNDKFRLFKSLSFMFDIEKKNTNKIKIKIFVVNFIAQIFFLCNVINYVEHANFFDNKNFEIVNVIDFFVRI